MPGKRAGTFLGLEWNHINCRYRSVSKRYSISSVRYVDPCTDWCAPCISIIPKGLERTNFSRILKSEEPLKSGTLIWRILEIPLLTGTDVIERYCSWGTLYARFHRSVHLNFLSNWEAIMCDLWDLFPEILWILLISVLIRQYLCLFMRIFDWVWSSG